MIRREIGLFLIVGLMTVAIDFFVYSLLLWVDVLGVVVSKACGFISGTIFAYYANKFWTFREAQTNGNVLAFVLLYVCTLGINISINWFAIGFAGGNGAAIYIAFILATGSSASLNFLGMKYFVFKSVKVQ